MRVFIIAAALLIGASPCAYAQNPPPKKAAPKAAAKKAAKPAPRAVPAEAGAAAPAVAGENPLAASFKDFCKVWMGKLAEREARNISLIKWDSGSGWVQGSYVGFAPDNTCTVDGSGASTVGKLTYLEVNYEKRGSTIEEAQKAPPHATETIEVTEIFRYEKGEWIY